MMYDKKIPNNIFSVLVIVIFFGGLLKTPNKKFEIVLITAKTENINRKRNILSIVNILFFSFF